LWSLLSVTPTESLGPALQQIGIGALIAVPAYATSWKLWQMFSASQTEVKDLQLERVQDQKDQVIRERELADRLGPLLAEAAKVLATAPERFDQALRQVSDARGANEVDQLMRRLEDTVGRISRERGP
jgi:hypothetical protein